ncbi:hypothetical protein M3O96_09580 [Aquiflexum sp. TKW24L]|uniref:hypothetical protein n=1 Tax=Aquiflexum sp. TKW24L TaxID=2942212 RepID=UPI0020C18A0A|nr:hypothetical protein [Aquiflexum sp. TKW24L]MCL6259338.1 hypothetical protein [Aquiflexum sp. TKW24L]
MKKIITPLLLVVFLNLICNYCFAQIEKKDYVIFLSGEIIPGNVKKPLDPRRYQDLEFSIDGIFDTIFKPEDIRGFKLANGAKYRAAIHPNTGETVFFEEIIVGEKSFLGYKDQLFIELEEGLKKLEFSQNKDVNMRQVNTESFGYIGLLTYGLGTDMEYEFVEKIRSVKPRKNEIKELFKEYHELKGYTFEEFGADYPILRISPSIGLGYNQMSQSVNGTYATVEPVSSSLAINALVDFHLVRDAPRFFITSGLIFRKFEAKMNIDFPVMGGRFVLYENYELNSIGIPLLFNYYLAGNDKFKVHTGIGMNYRLLNKTTNEISAEARRSNGELIESFNPQYLDVGNNIGLLMRLGVTTSITSKTALVLEGQFHRMSRYGEIFASAPGAQSSGHYKYSFHGYSLNAAIKF